MYLFIRWLITAVAILITAYLISGVEVSGLWAALWVAVFLGLFNVILRPVLILLTLPLNILTLGLFTFVINALLALLVSTIIQGFYVEGLLSAILFSIVLSAISYILNTLIKKTKDDDHKPPRGGGGRNSIEGEVVK